MIDAEAPPIRESVRLLFGEEEIGIFSRSGCSGEDIMKSLENQLSNIPENDCSFSGTGNRKGNFIVRDAPGFWGNKSTGVIY